MAKHSKRRLILTPGEREDAVNEAARQYAVERDRDRREAADARAEEIARAIDARIIKRPHPVYFTGYEGRHNADMQAAARIARSTISKPEASDASVWRQPNHIVSLGEEAEAMVRADEREKIATRLQGFAEAVKDTNRAKFEAFETAAVTARCVPWTPKTREAVLEEALREIATKYTVNDPARSVPYDGVAEYSKAGWAACRAIARRALEWRGQ